MKRTIELTVVIPTHNRSAVLKRVVEGLCSQRGVAECWELVVVEDGCSRTEKGKNRKGVEGSGLDARVISIPKKGAAAARNAGVREARGKRILFLGDDIVPDRGLIRAHLDRAKKHRGAVILGQVTWHPDLKLNDLMRSIAPEGDLNAYHLIKDPENVPWQVCYGSNLSMPRETALAFPYEEGFSGYGWEDIELGYRLSKKKIRIRFEPKAVGFHWHHYTKADWARRNRRAARGYLHFLSLHPETAVRREKEAALTEKRLRERIAELESEKMQLEWTHVSSERKAGEMIRRLQKTYGTRLAEAYAGAQRLAFPFLRFGKGWHPLSWNGKRFVKWMGLEGEFEPSGYRNLTRQVELHVANPSSVPLTLEVYRGERRIRSFRVKKGLSALSVLVSPARTKGERKIRLVLNRASLKGRREGGLAYGLMFTSIQTKFLSIPAPMASALQELASKA